MSDGLYDLEEIIAEIKSEDGHPPKPAGKNQDGEQTAPHPERAAQAGDTPARGKRESLPKGKPMHNTTETVRDAADLQSADGKYIKPVPAEAAVEDAPAPAKPAEDASKDTPVPEEASSDRTEVFGKELDMLFEDDSPKKRKAKKQKAEKPKKEKVKKDKIKKESSKEDAAASEPAKKTKAPKKAAPPANDDDDDNIEYMTDEDSERKFPYDFLNRTYQDTDEALHEISGKLLNMGMRLLALFPVWLISLYMTLAFPLKLPMPFGFSYFSMPFVYLLVFLLLEVAAVILASDVTVSGLVRLLKGKPTMDTLVLFASLSSMAYIITVIIRPQWGGWLPFTSATVGLCFFALSAKRRRFVSLKRTYKILRSDTSPTALKAQGTRRFKTAFMTYKGVFPEMSDISSPDTSERLSMYYSPLAILICIALATAASFGRQNPRSFTWCLSALSVISVSPALLISSALPHSIIGKKLFASGSTFVNSRSAFELSRCRSAIVTDNDLFPPGSIAIQSLKIGDGFGLEDVFSITASALEVIGGGLYSVFDETARQHYGWSLDVSEIRFFESGGMSARVGDDYVLIGTANFLMRMGVDVLSGVKLQNCLYVSINSRFAGVFALKYIAQPQVYSSFRMLRRAKVTPVLAVRDFLTTEAFIEDKFKLHADSCDYPGTQDRVDYSSDNFEESEPMAVMSHSNMYAYSELLLSSRKLTRTVTFNIICSILGCIVGLMIMYFLVSNMEVSSASPLNILVYMGCWALPVWLSSLIFTTI